MKYLVVIEADTNDGDYIENSQFASEEEIQIINKVISVVKDCNDAYNFPTGDQTGNDGLSARERYADAGLLSQFEFETLLDFVPYGERGIHTIEKVTIHTVTNTERLL